jgi:hypothetical protein
LIVAIHQPNFFPWLGYFDKIMHSDVFVFLDHVQFQKTGSMWTNRTRLPVNGTPSWITVPLDRSYQGYRQVNEMRILDDQPWREKLLRTLSMIYAKARYFDPVMQVLEKLINDREGNLAEYNILCVERLCEAIGITHRRFERSSRLTCRGASNALLASITRAVGGDTYMTGGGADDYLDESVFTAAGLRLLRQNYSPERYDQAGHRDFMPGLSIIDALMHLGFTGALKHVSREPGSASARAHSPLPIPPRTSPL